MASQTDRRENKTISQPPAWWAAFQAQAARNGESLSAFLGDCARANLDADLVDGLPDRPPAHRPRQDPNK